MPYKHQEPSMPIVTIFKRHVLKVQELTSIPFLFYFITTKNLNLQMACDYFRDIIPLKFLNLPFLRV